MSTLYSSAEAVITSSYAEGFSYSGVEAMQCGTVVVASDIACHKEIYGDCPVYFSPYDPQECFEAICAVFKLGHEERTEMSQRGFEQVKKYSESSVTAAWQGVIDHVASL